MRAENGVYTFAPSGSDLRAFLFHGHSEIKYGVTRDDFLSSVVERFLKT